VLGVAAQPPEILVLIAANAAEHRGDAAAKMRHLHAERRLAIPLDAVWGG
jgi:hypothetical protein